VDKYLVQGCQQLEALCSEPAAAAAAAAPSPGPGPQEASQDLRLRLQARLCTMYGLLTGVLTRLPDFRWRHLQQGAAGGCGPLRGR
jgi:hypothetical protein